MYLARLKASRRLKSQPAPNRRPAQAAPRRKLWNTVLVEEAATVVGKTACVCGNVYSVKFTGSIIYINMVGDYPNNPFTAVIVVKNRSNFNYKPEETLPGKLICVTGAVQNYKGKPEIVVETSSQIFTH